MPTSSPCTAPAVSAVDSRRLKSSVFHARHSQACVSRTSRRSQRRASVLTAAQQQQQPTAYREPEQNDFFDFDTSEAPFELPLETEQAQSDVAQEAENSAAAAPDEELAARDAGVQPAELRELDPTGQFPDPTSGDVDQEYVPIALHGCTFFIAASPNDELNFSNIQLLEERGESYTSPTINGELPQQPAVYQMVPWVQEKHGDLYNDKPDELMVHKMFLVRQDPETQALDFETVVCLDAATRSIALAEIHRTTSETDPDKLMLCITEGRLTISEAETLPTVDEVVQMAEMGIPRYPEEEGQEIEVPMLKEAEPAEDEMSGSDIDDDDILDDDFDAPDIPAVDFA